jgi:hypothetical protein
MVCELLPQQKLVFKQKKKKDEARAQEVTTLRF